MVKHSSLGRDRHNSEGINPQTATLISYFIAMLVLGTYFILSVKKAPLSTNTFYVVKILVCMAIGILSTALVGAIEVLIKYDLPYRMEIKATQGFAVALLVFIFWPRFTENWAYQVTDLTDEVDFRAWNPYHENDSCNISLVTRTVKMKVVKNPATNKSFNELFGTTNDHCPLGYVQLEDGFTIDKDLASSQPPRITYAVKANPEYFSRDTGSIGYTINYYNNFDLQHPNSFRNDVSKKFPYDVKTYKLRLVFNPKYLWKKIRMKYTAPAVEDVIFTNNANSAVFEHILKDVEPGTWVSFYIEI